MNRSNDKVYVENILGERFPVPNSPMAIKLMLEYVRETGIPAKVTL